MRSNLRQTTCKCMHLVRRGHFRSCDKDGGHIIQSAIAKNPTLYATSRLHLQIYNLKSN